jgi:hypothetical protein
MCARGEPYDGGFSFVSHIWDTKTPVRKTSQVKGIRQGVADRMGVIILHGE